jgi:hypothetical protein
MPPLLPAPRPSPAAVARAIEAYRRATALRPPAEPIPASWRPAPPPGQPWRVLAGIALGAGAVLLLRALLA